MIGAMTCINFDFEDDSVFSSGYEHHLMCDTSKFSSPESYSSNNAIIIADKTIDLVEQEGSVILFLKLLE